MQPFVRVDHNTIPDPTAPYVFFPSAVLYLRDKAKARMARKNERTVLPWQSDSYEEALAFLVNCLRANAKQYVSQTGLSVDSLVQHYLSLLIAKKLAPTTSLSADSMAALEAPELVLASYRELVETGIGLKSSSGLHHGNTVSGYKLAHLLMVFFSLLKWPQRRCYHGCTTSLKRWASSTAPKPSGCSLY